MYEKYVFNLNPNNCNYIFIIFLEILYILNVYLLYTVIFKIGKLSYWIFIVFDTHVISLLSYVIIITEFRWGHCILGDLDWRPWLVIPAFEYAEHNTDNGS